MDEIPDLNVILTVDDEIPDLNLTVHQIPDLTVAVDEDLDLNVAVDENLDLNVAVDENPDLNVAVDENLDQNLAVGENLDQNLTVGETLGQNMTVGESSGQNLTVGESSGQNLTVGETSGQNMTVGETSGQNLTFRETSDQNLTVGETSDKNTETDDAEASENETAYDFAFVMKPIKVLKDAVEALADPKFNPMQEALIEVGERGCDITAWAFNLETGSDTFGYLRLNAAALQGFQCKKPYRKSLSLKDIRKLFESAEEFGAESVHLFVEEGSNSLSWDFGPTEPDSIDLKEVDPAYEEFPIRISYEFEAVIPSPVLKAMSRKLRNQATPFPETVEVWLERATVRLSNETVFTSSKRKNRQVHKLSVEWQYWEALESASDTAHKVSVYLVGYPYEALMLRFHLEHLGDLVFLKQADFDNVPQLPSLGQFHKLN